ncbi:DUF488 family protein [Parablastomonas sp. CN1-191]|uniref:DUF488 domain-containing protein n=1 Tax=Parablastomonas sp. CN1-191 TaxID=3400908 RepID=UPI003BF88E42
MKLYTIGFTKSTAQHFFNRLRVSGVKRVLDTRANRTSQLAGFSKETDLNFFLSEIASISYRAEDLLAPDKALLKAYREKQIGWDEYARRYLANLSSKSVEKRFVNDGLLDNSCLLCSEHEPDHCHRRLAAEYLRDVLQGVEIRHL